MGRCTFNELAKRASSCGLSLTRIDSYPSASSTTPAIKPIPTLVAAYAIALMVVGIVLLFAPEILLSAEAPASPDTLVLVQLVSAALLGFGVANWTGRGVLLGGIYGRPIVAGNQAFAFVGALVLLRGLPSGLSPAGWGLLVLLVLGALLYSLLLFRPPKPDRSSPNAT